MQHLLLSRASLCVLHKPKPRQRSKNNCFLIGRNLEKDQAYLGGLRQTGRADTQLTAVSASQQSQTGDLR